MNKHIYYNHLKISIGALNLEDAQNQVIVDLKYEGTKKLKNEIQKFLKKENTKNLLIATSDFDEALRFLKKELYFIEAAGGLIRNKNHYLFIKRLGKWDLPKGKLDKGETTEIAAIRECEEECSVKELKIMKPLPNTYHIYKYKDGFALKVTYWFEMQTDYDKPLKPQTEEHIEEVKWLTFDEVKNIVLKNTYITIQELVTHFFEL